MREVKSKIEHLIMPECKKINYITINFRDGQGLKRYLINQHISAIDLDINYVE
mgnify:CR=1 FL=1